MTLPDPNAYSLDINDPDDAELIEYFLGELPDRVEAITAAITDNNIEDLKRITHQLKGAAPGFGFPAIGSAAAEIEGQIRDLDETVASCDSVRAQVDGLISLCQSYISPSS